MKVLLITSASAPHIGGEEVYLEKLVPALEERGIQVRVLVLSTIKHITSNYTQDSQVSFIYVHNPYTYCGLFERNIISPSLYRKIRREIRTFTPDVVHLHTVFFLKTVLFAAYHIPKVQTFHEVSIILPLYPLFFAEDPNTDYVGELDFKKGKRIGLKYRTLFIDHYLLSDHRISKRITKLFLCPSNYLADVAKKVGLTPTIHLPYFQDADRAEVIHENKSDNEYFLFVGRLETIKGADQLLRAFSLLKKQYEKARLIIAGDGTQSLELKLLSKKLGIDAHVDFLGWVDNSKLSVYYENARGIIIPSIYPEVSPLVAFEAMRYNKPVIAYSVGGLPEIVQQRETGLLVERGYIQGLSDACQQIYTNPTYAQQLGDAGRKYLEKHYTKKEHVDRLIAIYESLCKL